MSYIADIHSELDASDKTQRRNWKFWKHDITSGEEGNAPESVTGVQGLYDDVLALNALFDPESPSHRLVRGTRMMKVIYGFGDASGAGFGGTWSEAKNDTLKYRFGIWGSDMDDSSSNNREL